MPYKDMREFLDVLRKDGQLKDCDVPIKAAHGDNELQALMRLLCQNDGPALMLNNLEGYNTPDIPVIFNPFGTRERTGMMIDERDPLESKKKHARVLGDPASWIDPVVVDRDEAPCKDVVINKDDISLDKQLPHLWFGKEAASYVTGAVGITHDPETGLRNVGCYRMSQLWNAVHPMGEEYPEEQQKKQLSVFAFWNPPMSQIGLHLAKATAMGKRLEVAFACQCDPAIHLAGGTGLPFGQDEFKFAGGLRGAPVELVKAETVDIDVPATAEFIIEGVFIPESETTIGNHSNPVGYYDAIQVFPRFEVTAITHRKNPLWYATMEMIPPFDHNYQALMPVETEVLADLQGKLPQVQDVVVTPNMTYIVQLNVDGAGKPHAEFGKHILHAVWGASGRWGRTAKIVIVVGPDVDPYDMDSIEWAIATRVQPATDTIINESGQAFVLDPSAPKGHHGFPVVGSQIGIDATMKVPERFESYQEVSQPTAEEVASIADKLKGLLG
ncbi:MAG: UbiD family decarboxylase [Gammaproteobacteria bacterium]